MKYNWQWTRTPAHASPRYKVQNRMNIIFREFVNRNMVYEASLGRHKIE